MMMLPRAETPNADNIAETPNADDNDNMYNQLDVWSQSDHEEERRPAAACIVDDLIAKTPPNTLDDDNDPAAPPTDMDTERATATANVVIIEGATGVDSEIDKVITEGATATTAMSIDNTTGDIVAGPSTGNDVSQDPWLYCF